MNSMIENLINGNLTDAKRQAKRFSELSISVHLTDIMGWSDERALAAAHYLKTGNDFQKYADAV